LEQVEIHVFGGTGVYCEYLILVLMYIFKTLVVISYGSQRLD